MRIYFYGATLEAANKKCRTFVKNLLANEPQDQQINVTATCVPHYAVPDEIPIPKGHKFHVYCEYNVMAKS